MIVGIGIDLVETGRFRRVLEAWGERFERRVFTTAEVEACRGRADRVEGLAARFAAKEACLKALGTGWSQGLAPRQVEVVREGGRPSIRLHGAADARARALDVGRILLSLTHEASAAAAFVVLEATPDP
jgi:holo-[acyl-carrier protein] synthase